MAFEYNISIKKYTMASVYGKWSLLMQVYAIWLKNNLVSRPWLVAAAINCPQVAVMNQ